MLVLVSLIGITSHGSMIRLVTLLHTVIRRPLIHSGSWFEACGLVLIRGLVILIMIIVKSTVFVDATLVKKVSIWIDKRPTWVDVEAVLIIVAARWVSMSGLSCCVCIKSGPLDIHFLMGASVSSRKIRVVLTRLIVTSLMLAH